MFWLFKEINKESNRIANIARFWQLLDDTCQIWHFRGFFKIKSRIVAQMFLHPPITGIFNTIFWQNCQNFIVSCQSFWWQLPNLTNPSWRPTKLDLYDFTKSKQVLITRSLLHFRFFRIKFQFTHPSKSNSFKRN